MNMDANMDANVDANEDTALLKQQKDANGGIKEDGIEIRCSNTSCSGKDRRSVATILKDIRNGNSEKPTLTDKFVLYRADEVPEYLSYNKYYLSGYRMAFTKRLALRSVFKLHFETLNIWTHFVPFTVFLFVLLPYSVASLPQLNGNSTVADYVVMVVFNLTAMVMLGCSTLFHTFCCCGTESFSWFHSLDYIGIVCMIGGSALPVAWYGLICVPIARAVYIALSVIASIVLIYQLMKPDSYMHKVKDTRYNLAMFWGFGLIHGIPFVHMCATASNDPGLWGALGHGLPWFGAAIGCYAFGSLFFATYFPECLFAPGTLDRFGEMSHAIWHVFVAAAAVFSYKCTWEFVGHVPDAVTC